MAQEPPKQQLDVRTIDGPPFDTIMSTLSTLPPGERLRLIADFEPIPLYEVLEARGYQYETNQRGESEFHVLISEE